MDDAQVMRFIDADAALMLQTDTKKAMHDMAYDRRANRSMRL